MRLMWLNRTVLGKKWRFENNLLFLQILKHLSYKIQAVI